MAQNDCDELLLQEYKICNDKAHRYMAVTWQIGAIFISVSIAMMGLSVEVFPKVIGVSLLFLVWALLGTWYVTFKRNNWICARAYERAKAIERYLNIKQGVAPLKYLRAEKGIKEEIESLPINLWIEELDREGKTFKLTYYTEFILGFILTFSFVILGFYIGVNFL